MHSVVVSVGLQDEAVERFDENVLLRDVVMIEFDRVMIGSSFY